MPTILVIEDDATILEQVVEILMLDHYNILSADNGQDGVALAKRHLPDLVICDVMMPLLDGYGTLEALREDPTTAAIPFIFLTARAEMNELRKGMHHGADDYIAKPFSPDDLLKAVETRLEKYATLHERYEKQLEDLRGSIVTTLPHELRTPLSAILGYATFLADDVEGFSPDEMRDMLLSIKRSAMRLNRLVENYLVYAQVELAGMDQAKLDALRSYHRMNPASATDAQHVAQRIADNYERRADLRVDVATVFIYITMEDYHKLLEELIDNAFKFSLPGSRVDVTGVAEAAEAENETTYDAAEKTFVLTIRDAGRGMTTEQLKQLGAMRQFDRQMYEQQGSGLGLMIARRLVDLHGGAWDITSRVDKGTTLTLRFGIADL